MSFSQTLINQINTQTIGTAGAMVSAPAGAGGNNGGTIDDVFSGAVFQDPSEGLNLYPTATGGAASAGVLGAIGMNGSGTADTVAGVTTLVLTDGLNGQPGGSAGNGATGTVDLESFTVGAPGALNDYVSIAPTARGGTAPIGAFGGGGGDSGYDEMYGSPPNEEIIEGGRPGDGGAGGAGGQGGGAVTTINALADNSFGGAYLNLTATGAAGGRGGVSGGGGEGGAAVSAGGTGGIGGNGGQGIATLSDSSVDDTSEVNITLQSVGGAGGNGGQASAAGFTQNNNDPYLSGNVTVDVYGNNPSGGVGGNSGAALSVLNDNTLTGPIIYVTITSISQTPGSGGEGTSQTNVSTATFEKYAGDPGPTGAPGLQGSQSITMTDNVVTIGSLNAGNGYGTANSVSLALNIGSSIVTSPANVPLDGGAGGNLVFTGNSFTGTGHSLFDVQYMGPGVTLDTLNNDIKINGSQANPMTGFTNFTIGSSDTVVIGAGGPYTVTVAPDPDTVVIIPGHGNLTVYSATTSDVVLSFQGYGSALGGLSQLIADTSNSGGNTYITIPGDGALELASVTWAPSAQDTSIACFCAGTRIATPGGGVAVEDLRQGDAILSAFGGTAPVQWIGRRTLDCRRHPRPEQIWPVRIAANAFAPGQPATPLFLSPDHAVFAADRLIPIKYLINGASIAQIPYDGITYFHVELPSHDVLLADGLAVESYLDTGNRPAFENAGPAVTMHPDFSLQTWSESACAELLLSGPALTALRRQLLARLPALGHAITADPALSLQIDNIPGAPCHDGTWLRLALPPGARHLRLTSRAAAPAELDPASVDTRRLGVPLQYLTCDGHAVTRDDPRLVTGWHPPEPTLRWTNGDGRIDVTGIRLVELRLAPSALCYHATNPAPASRAA